MVEEKHSPFQTNIKYYAKQISETILALLLIRSKSGMSVTADHVA